MPTRDSEVEFRKVDLNEDFEIKNACIVCSVFTMQFLNRINRARFCKSVYDGLNDGGAFFICEKIYQETGMMQEVLSFSHYDHKRKSFSDSEILKKEKDLRYIMKPNTYRQNIDLLHNAGFREITAFWQSYNFIGIIAIK